MDLWLLRHAVAEERADSGRDADRALTADGRRRARDVGKALARLDPKIERVLTSPFRRARETALPAAEALGLRKRVQETSNLEPPVDPRKILDELREEKAEAVLLVGHQPHLGLLLGRLLTGRRGLELAMKKAGVAWLTWDGGTTGELRAFLPPKLLERLARLR